MDEKDFYNEKEERKPAKLLCPHCRMENEYQLAWLVRTKKNSLPPRADERDQAKFKNAKNYMLRREDKVMCVNPRCRKNFEVSGVQSVVFHDATPIPKQIEAAEPEADSGKPKEDPRVAALRRAFSKR